MTTGETIDVGAVTGKLRVLAQDKRHQILIVDDDELELALIADRLESHGFETVRAANGVEALRLIEDHVIAVVLVDWEMPVMDGIELTERLRARGLNDASIILLTVRDSILDYQTGYRAGVDDYVSKKVRDTELLARIHAGLNTFVLRRALREAQAALADALTVKY
jgi:DNA-binding response OmpR family regulator